MKKTKFRPWRWIAVIVLLIGSFYCGHKWGDQYFAAYSEMGLPGIKIEITTPTD